MTVLHSPERAFETNMRGREREGKNTHSERPFIVICLLLLSSFILWPFYSSLILPYYPPERWCLSCLSVKCFTHSFGPCLRCSLSLSLPLFIFLVLFHLLFLCKAIIAIAHSSSWPQGLTGRLVTLGALTEEREREREKEREGEGERTDLFLSF